MCVSEWIMQENCGTRGWMRILRGEVSLSRMTLFVSTGAVGRGLLVLVFPRTHTCSILAVFRVNPHSATLHAHAARRQCNAHVHTNTQEKDGTGSLLTQDFFESRVHGFWGEISLWFTSKCCVFQVILLTDAEYPYGS